MSFTAHFINGPRHGDISRIPERVHYIDVAVAHNDKVDMWSNRAAPYQSSYGVGRYDRQGAVYSGHGVGYQHQTEEELIFVWKGIQR